MKANARTRQADRDAAQVGIGTLIVFVATILTSAVAAGVVIDSTNSLQEKVSRTGSQASDQVANNLVIGIVQGIANGSGTLLDALNITMSIGPGSRQVDLAQMLIRISNGTVVKQLTYNTGGANTTYSATSLRDPAGFFTASQPAVSPGTLVVLNINLTANGAALDVKPRRTVELVLQPEVGSRLGVELQTPPSFTASGIVILK